LVALVSGGEGGALRIRMVRAMLHSAEKIIGDVGYAFAKALVGGEFDAARAMLSGALADEWPPWRLEQALAEMIEYGDGPADHVEVIQVDSMAGWPARESSDLGWAYVAICGDGFNEAVSVVVADEGGRTVIRDLEWGRP
jgi:hypothetical protein